MLAADAGHADRLAMLAMMAGLLFLVCWLVGYDGWLS